MKNVVTFVVALIFGFLVGVGVGQASIAGKANELPVEKIDDIIIYDVPLSEFGKKIPNGKYLYSNYDKEKFVAR